jgi:hypothetical protein
MKVLELKGYKSLRALNAFHALMLGMKMLPMYMGESYETFYARFCQMPENEQGRMIREAALFVELSKEEIEALASFCCDKNGVPYESTNVSNLKPDELIEVICAVCQEIGRIKIDIVTEKEKKKFLTLL